MTDCPSWRRLTAHRLAAPDAEPPAGWEAALEHLEGCSACRQEAYAADPSLAFRRLPEVPVGAEEVARMRAGVDALRRAQAVDYRADRVAGAAAAPSRAAGGWKRLAAAAVLVAALLAVHGSRPFDPAATSRAGAVEPALPADAALDPWTGGAGIEPEILELWASLPVAVDDVDHPTASVYHIDDEDVDVMMVVGDGLDV